MGYKPGVASETWSGSSGVDLYAIELSDYQALGLIAFCNYVEKSGDLDFARTTWSQWQLQIEWLLSKINKTTGLVSYDGFTIFGPPDGGVVSSCSLLQALNQAANVATAINQMTSASMYLAAAKNLATAINTHLWNDKLGAYSLSPESPNDYSLAGLAFCLLSGATNATQASRSISALSALKLEPGYKGSTEVNSSDPTVNISPFTNGLLLSALLRHNSSNKNASIMALELMQTLWGTMLANNKTSQAQAGNTSLKLGRLA